MPKLTNEKQLSILGIVLYHLFPAVPTLLFAIFLAHPAWTTNLPIFVSLLISFALFLIPIQWLIIYFWSYKEKKQIRDIIAYNEKKSKSKTVIWSIPCIIFAAFVFTIGTKIEKPFWSIYNGIPHWFIIDRYAHFSGKMLSIVIVLNYILRGLLLPITEEIYFRGFLLPRMEKLGKYAPIVSAALFSIYHLFAPWENVSRTLAVLPFVYLVWKKKDIWIGVISHCAVNLLSCTVLLFSVL